MSDQLRVSSILSVMAAIVLGWFAGLFFPQIMVYAAFPAALFEHALLLLVAPLFFSAVIVGIAAFGDLKKAGRSFSRLFWYYIGSGTLAAVVAAVVVMIARPGDGASWFGHAGAPLLSSAMGYSYWDILGAIIPVNLPGSIINGQYVGLFLFSVALGFFLIQFERQGQMFSDIVGTFLGLQKRILGIIARILPFGLFFVLGSAVASNAEFLSSTAGSFMSFSIWLIVALMAFAIIGLPLVQWTVTGESPLKYLLNMKPALAVAFATGSAAAAFPMLYHFVSNEADDDRVAGTALPLGLLIGTHGSTILTVSLTIFVSQAIGVNLSMMQIVMVLLAAVLIPVGIVGFPLAQAVVLGAMFQALGFPAEAFALLALIWGGEWLISRFVAPVNLLSSGVGAAVVASMYDLKTARAAQPRRSAPHRSEERRDDRRHGHDERRDRDRRSGGDEQSRERSFDGPRGRRDFSGRDRDRDRDRGNRRPSRDGRPDRRREGGRDGERGQQSGGRFQRPNRDDRGGRPRQDRPYRDRDRDAQNERTGEERGNDERPVEAVTNVPQAHETKPTFQDSSESHEQTSAEVRYGRTARPKFERNSGGNEGERSESSEPPDAPKETESSASSEMAYGRSRRRPDFVKGESGGSDNGNATTDEEPVMTGELSFGRGRRRPGGK